MDQVATLQWYDLVRMITIVSSLTTMYLLVHTYFLHHSDFTPRVMDHWLSKNLFLFSGFVGSIEAIVVNRPNNGTLFIVCFASLFVLRATLNSESPNDVEESPHFRKH